MPLHRNDLSRRFFLDVSADGAVSIRERGQPLTPCALPVFTTDTHEEALMIQLRHCKLARDRSGIYRLNECPDDLDALYEVAAMFRDTHEGRLRKAG
jgi:hypothetical protein